MSDRLDIDALLIGRLYGELDEADEARLQAHLESHPADRTALADMTRTRESVRESRITTLPHEPPQSISALLLQEAARRAPKQVEAREGWFARFVASLRHPAMAAAMTLVVVASFAGIVYVKKGDHFAEQSKSETTVDRAPVMSAPSGAAAATMSAGSAAPSPEPVATPRGGEASADKADDVDGAFEGAKDAKDEYKVQLQEPPRQPAPAPKSRKGASSAGATSTMEVTTGRSARQPQELADDEAPAKQQFAEPPARDTTANAPGMAPESRAPVAPAPPPPPPQIGAAGGSAPAGAPKSAPAKKETSKEDSGELAWARTQHARVVDRARAGNCSEAASIAVQLSNRAPGYYTQYVQNDRQLKQCFTAINRERELDAERAQKVRVKRSEESMPPPADSINSPK